MSAGYQGPDVSGIAGRVSTHGSNNFMNFSNARLDECLEEALKTSDHETRKAYYSEVQKNYERRNADGNPARQRRKNADQEIFIRRSVTGSG